MSKRILTVEQMLHLAVEETHEKPALMFLQLIPNYKFKGKDQWISQWHYTKEEPLYNKDLWCIHGFKIIDGRKLNYTFLVSGEMVRENTAQLGFLIEENVKREINKTLNP